ncbi:MAG: hypothetical protein JWN28_832 [Candidatus Saccharibacteria bacterium]|nr:hypothetical protein [Candidatus Saccharibacteria bacterium]
MAGFFLLFGLAFFLTPVSAVAATNNGCEVDTAIIHCSNVNADGGIKNTGLWSILLMVINILTAGVGVLALAGLVYGSILYTSAGGSQEQTKKAMTVFSNVVIGVIAFAGMWALLNFLIPGGVFKDL